MRRLHNALGVSPPEEKPCGVITPRVKNDNLEYCACPRCPNPLTELELDAGRALRTKCLNTGPPGNFHHLIL